MILYVTAPRFDIQTHEWSISIYRPDREVSRIRSEDSSIIREYYNKYMNAMLHNKILQHQR